MMDHSILADGHQHFQTSNKWLGSRDGPSLSTYHTLSPMVTILDSLLVDNIRVYIFDITLVVAQY